METKGTSRFAGSPYEATGFFRLEGAGSRWRLIDPEGHPFISIGLNHIDETNLKYPHNIHVWKEKYGSRTKWIEGVAGDLRQWGFNTIGWTQEVITSDHRHSYPWAAADFDIAGLPYCVLLPVADIEYFNLHPVYPDVFSDAFEMYCEYLARSICSEHADKRNLLGYFFVDVPAWTPHDTGAYFEDGLDVETQEGRQRLKEIASKYYETICRSIRHYDVHHLILGDRYNGNCGIPDVVLEAMTPHVDVLSIQYFASYDRMIGNLRRWQEVSVKPVLIADIGCRCPNHFWNQEKPPGTATQKDRAAFYRSTFENLLKDSWFVGWHWCAHIENPVRANGVKDPWDVPHNDFLEPAGEFNRAVCAR